MAHVMSCKGIHVSSGRLVIFSQTKAFLKIKIPNFHLKLGDCPPTSIYNNDDTWATLTILRWDPLC